MTDLVSLSDLQAQLQQIAETKVDANDAYAILRQTQVTYEADRLTSAQANSTLTQQVNALNVLNSNQAIKIDGLTSDKAALSNQVTSLTAQVATLTQTDTDLAATIALDDATIAALRVQVTDLSPDVTVTIGAQSGISRFAPAVTWVTNPNTWRQAGWPNVKANIPSMVGAQSTHFWPFGNDVCWSWNGTGTLPPAPNNFYGETTAGGTVAKPALNSFVGSLVKMREVDPNGPLHIKAFMAEWWMKHKVHMDNTCTNLTYADRWDAENGRVKFTRLAEWKLLVKTGCKIAFAAPFNVRYVSVWNELKEFWDGVNNRYDMTYNSGTETTPMGFVYFYDQTVQAILAAATELGIPLTDIKIGGAYVPLRGRGTADGTAVPVGHMLRNRPYGNTEKHPVIAFETFATEVKNRGLRLDFVSVDGADGNKDGVYPAPDDWVNGLRWHDWHMWIKGVLTSRGLDATMPIIWDEWYRSPVINPPTGTTVQKQIYRTALKADAMITMIKDGVQWAMSWGPVPLSADDDGSMLTDATLATGGQVVPFGALCQLFKEHFPPGTPIFDATVVGDGVSTIVSNKVAMLASISSVPHHVALGGDVYALAPYAVRVVRR